MSITDVALSHALDDLRERYLQDGDVLAIWEAIRRVTARNQGPAKPGEVSFPMPDWINNYLLTSAEKIERLGLGIDPADDRPLISIPFDEVGGLRKVPQSDGSGQSRFSDERSKYIGQALGLVRKGWSAFQCHDREMSDDLHLWIHDDPQLKSDRQLRREVQGTLSDLIQRQESITAPAFRNRLSKARRTGRRSKAVTKPTSQSSD